MEINYKITNRILRDTCLSGYLPEGDAARTWDLLSQVRKKKEVGGSLPRLLSSVSYELLMERPWELLPKGVTDEVA